LRRWAPETGVVVVTHSADPGHALAVLGGGARRSAYLLKERVRNRAEPTAAIRAVAGGASIVDPRIRERLLVTQRLSDHSPLRELTSREREVLEEVAAGKSNQAIAATLLLTQRAVEKHINSIFRKFGLNGTPQVSKRVKAVLLPRAERASITCNG
jgi:DNA-binding NarL/FixJ family response regulator